jgi:hypothetical protein
VATCLPEQIDFDLDPAKVKTDAVDSCKICYFSCLFSKTEFLFYVPFAVFVWCVGLRSVGAWLRGLAWFGVLWCFMIVQRTFHNSNLLYFNTLCANEGRGGSRAPNNGVVHTPSPRKRKKRKKKIEKKKKEKFENEKFFIK